jgi:hypothetical protein
VCRRLIPLSLFFLLPYFLGISNNNPSLASLVAHAYRVVGYPLSFVGIFQLNFAPSRTELLKRDVSTISSFLPIKSNTCYTSKSCVRDGEENGLTVALRKFDDEIHDVSYVLYEMRCFYMNTIYCTILYVTLLP